MGSSKRWVNQNEEEVNRHQGRANVPRCNPGMSLHLANLRGTTMTSILTNVAAMAALQTLRTLGTDMENTQKRVSTGLRVGTASDNAAYWSIATTMRSDNGALSAVQDALGLGAAKVDTAYAGMEGVVDVISEMKAKIVVASE